MKMTFNDALNRGTFLVVQTADFFGPDGRPKYRDMGLDVLKAHPHIEYKRLEEDLPELCTDQIKSANGVIVGSAKVTANSLSVSDQLLAIGRYGVGYEAVDVEACTRANVVVFITRGAVDRSMAEATIAWIFALAYRVRTKDQLMRSGRWSDRSQFMGSQLCGRTLGLVGLGGIAREVVRLLKGFGIGTLLAYDPFVDLQAAERLGVRLVGLGELMTSADFVSIHCPLNDRTRNLIGANEIALMKPDAYLINTARGGIVDEDALWQALVNNRIAGAALDCFRDEPVTKPNRFAEIDNVLLAPHSIGWTNELYRDIGRAVCQGMVDLSLGVMPKGVVNPEVFNRPAFTEKWARLRIGH